MRFPIRIIPNEPLAVYLYDTIKKVRLKAVLQTRGTTREYGAVVQRREAYKNQKLRAGIYENMQYRK